MFKKSMILLGMLVVTTSLCLAQAQTDQKPVVKQTPIKQTSAASGKDMFIQYCAPCHGGSRAGRHNPARASLSSTPPPSGVREKCRSHQ